MIAPLGMNPLRQLGADEQPVFGMDFGRPPHPSAQFHLARCCPQSGSRWIGGEGFAARPLLVGAKVDARFPEGFHIGDLRGSEETFYPFPFAESRCQVCEYLVI